MGGVMQDLIYVSAHFVNNVWLLAEVKITPGGNSVVVSFNVYELSLQYWGSEQH